VNEVANSSSQLLMNRTYTTEFTRSKGSGPRQDFTYLPEEDVYRCAAGERLKYYYTNVENGLGLRRYWTNARRTCALKSRCTPAVQTRISPGGGTRMCWRLCRGGSTRQPQAMRRRRESVLAAPFCSVSDRGVLRHSCRLPG